MLREILLMVKEILPSSKHLTIPWISICRRNLMLYMQVVIPYNCVTHNCVSIVSLKFSGNTVRFHDKLFYYILANNSLRPNIVSLKYSSVATFANNFDMHTCLFQFNIYCLNGVSYGLKLIHSYVFSHLERNAFGNFNLEAKHKG